MPQAGSYVGTAQSRVDGRAKVTGAAKYAGEFNVPGLAHGVVISSAIAKGRIKSIDASAALAVPGVVQVFTHENRPRAASSSPGSYSDQVAPPGSPFRPLYDDRVVFSGQPIALVVAEELGVATYAASLVRVEYQVETHTTDLDLARADAYEPPEKRFGSLPDP
ncbi:MAG TPA: xanthine dehydrogenase family protein molybdopterin-binding subunit, partial [Hyphomicrobiaceae bacterium]|nr:xanthine dehydrogenase family protein molybdopterin-binding subunit [Hyphomicrobiaceae bacterium]